MGLSKLFILFISLTSVVSVGCLWMWAVSKEKKEDEE